MNKKQPTYLKATIKEKYARFASFMIDTLIINMFAQVFFFYLLVGFVHLTFTNIVVDFGVVLFYLLYMIFISLVYQIVCYRFIRNSLGKQLMRLQYYYNDGTRLEMSELIQRELTKYYLLYATIVIYAVYSFYRMIMRSEKEYKPYHDRKIGTFVSWKA